MFFLRAQSFGHIFQFLILLNRCDGLESIEATSPSLTEAAAPFCGKCAGFSYGSHMIGVNEVAEP